MYRVSVSAMVWNKLFTNFPGTAPLSRGEMWSLIQFQKKVLTEQLLTICPLLGLCNINAITPSFSAA